MARAMAAHATEPAVDERVFGWTDLRVALEALPLGLHFGKTCLLF
jgi:hypothetical protein